MKRISLIANIVLAVAVVVLYIFYFTDKGRKTGTGKLETESIAVDLPSGSIVYIHLDSLMNRFDLFHDLNNDLEAKAKVIDDDLNRKGRTFERDALDYQDKVQKGLLTRSQAEAQGTLLENRRHELQQYAQQKQIELSEEQQVMINRVFHELNTFLESYNQEHGFALILTTSAATNNVIIGDRSLDITRAVAAGLNAQYAQSKRR